MSNINRATIKTRNTAVSNGIDKHIPASISIGSVKYTPAELKALFTAQNTALDAADAKHKEWVDQLQVANAVGARAHAVYRLLRSFLIGQFGNEAHAVLNDFGMKAPKTSGAKTVKVKADAAAKRAATRAARHTMGPVQRKAVTGATTKAPGAHAAPATEAPATPAPAATKPTITT